MRIIEPRAEILGVLDGRSILQHIEQCGRVCYKSEDKITDDSAKKFVRNIILRGQYGLSLTAAYRTSWSGTGWQATARRARGTAIILVISSATKSL